MKLPAIALIPILALVAAACTSVPAATSPPTVNPNVKTTDQPTTAPATLVVAQPTDTPLDVAPPAGALGYSDSADVGWLGSYCWHGTCADAPQIPDRESLPKITVPVGTLIFSLDGAEFANWIASFGPGGNSLSLLAEGGIPFDPDASPPSSGQLQSFVEFDSPPAGDWVVTVQVFLPGGDVSYAWHVVVE
jgi:hypothetical protein